MNLVLGSESVLDVASQTVDMAGCLGLLSFGWGWFWCVCFNSFVCILGKRFRNQKKVCKHCYALLYYITIYSTYNGRCLFLRVLKIWIYIHVYIITNDTNNVHGHETITPYLPYCYHYSYPIL